MVFSQALQTHEAFHNQQVVIAYLQAKMELRVCRFRANPYWWMQLDAECWSEHFR